MTKTRHNGILRWLATLCLWGCLASVIRGQSKTDKLGESLRVDVAVDLQSDLGPVRHAAAGILHSFSPDAPPDEWVAPLRLKVFRGRGVERELFQPGFHERLGRLGVERIQVVLSDSYGYPNGFCGWPASVESLRCWEAVVEKTVRGCIERGMDVEFDIWNEPDIPYFWGGSREAWFEAWGRGVRKVRELRPEAAIVGPSISRFDLKFLEDFLLYAKSNNCLPDVLSWHELGAAGGGRIPVHAKQARELVSRLGVPVSRFSINEIIPQNRQFNPATAVSYLAGVERSGVESACHSCWGDEGGSNCENNSLDGLLTPGNARPRAVWWVFKAYADMTGRMVRIASRSREANLRARMDGLACLDAETRCLTLMLANLETTQTLAPTLALSNLAAADTAPFRTGTSALVVAQRIPDTGPAPLDFPETVLEKRVALSGDSARIQIPDLPPGAALCIHIRLCIRDADGRGLRVSGSRPN